MYALIYDDHNLGQPAKAVISVHRSRNAAENALEERKRRLGKKVWECNTRIVWVAKRVKVGDHVRTGEFSTWRPGEKIPPGELYSDTD